MGRLLLVVAVVAALAFVVFRLINPVGGGTPSATATTPPVVTAAGSPLPRPRPSSAAPSPTPAASVPVAPLTFDSVSFLNAELGWVAGGTGRATTTLLVSRTTDGGMTWSAGVAVTQRPPDPSEVAVRFATPTDGWVSALGLYSTTDGGATWRSAGLTGWVAPVQVAGTTAWALRYPCGPSEQCPPELLVSTLGSATWALAPHQPALLGGPATLVRAGASVAYLSASSPGSTPPVRVVLWKTTDGGATWVPATSPCPAALDEATLAASGTALWMVCTEAAHDEDQDKAIYVSADDGASWTLRASSGGTAPPAVGTLGSPGAVLGLTLSGPSTGFLVLAGYGVVRSTDSGATWSSTSVTAKAMPSGNDVLMATFSGTSDGWVTTCCGGGVPYGSPGLFATTDGGATWSPVAVSP